jgi:hypothetical protein
MVRNARTKVWGHTTAWYERLATMQEGYFYPWKSAIAEGDGETAYTALVQQHLTPETDVVEAGCGHGVDAVAFAPLCRSFRGYDQVEKWISLCRGKCDEAGIDNAVFLCRNSSADRNGGRVTVPALSASTDLVISRRGPTNCIEDVPRFCRPGATLIQLNPLAAPERAPWDDELPVDLQLGEPEGGGDAGMRQTVSERLAKVGLSLHSWWIHDVPEWFLTPKDLYDFLTFGNADDEVPAWRDVEADLTRIFERHADDTGLPWRHRRFLWKSVVP